MLFAVVVTDLFFQY